MWFIIGKAKVVRIAMLCCASLGLWLLAQLLPMAASPEPAGRIVLIIDDFGNRADGTEAMLDLGIPITVAVMPFQPFSEMEARMAVAADLEVIMHLPMEPEQGKPEWLGPNGITTDLPEGEIRDRVMRGLARVPGAAGISNHMGSKATADRRVMKAVLAVARQEDMFFLDSRTTPHSVVEELAEAMGVSVLVRDVFLDGQKDQHHIESRLAKLGDIALDRGHAVGIGHVGIEGGTVTARAIQAMIPLLKARGLEFVSAAELLLLIEPRPVARDQQPYQPVPPAEATEASREHNSLSPDAPKE